jgi:hypothetical protein
MHPELQSMTNTEGVDDDLEPFDCFEPISEGSQFSNTPTELTSVLTTMFNAVDQITAALVDGQRKCHEAEVEAQFAVLSQCPK